MSRHLEPESEQQGSNCGAAASRSHWHTHNTNLQWVSAVNCFLSHQITNYNQTLTEIIWEFLLFDLCFGISVWSASRPLTWRRWGLVLHPATRGLASLQQNVFEKFLLSVILNQSKSHSWTCDFEYKDISKYASSHPSVSSHLNLIRGQVSENQIQRNMCNHVYIWP